MRRLLMPALLTVLMTAPAAAVSTLTVPVTVSLASVQEAANARVPLEFARVDETRSFAGGLLSVKLGGTVTRAGHVRVGPTADGSGLVVRVPIRAALRATPGGAGAVLARDFGGEATVSLTVTPYVTPQWEAGVRVRGDYTWTDPLSVELAPGVRVSVQALVDTQVRAQLDRVTAQVETAVREGARLRERAQTLWTRAAQPWTLPTPEPAYARAQPRSLSVTPIRFTPDALKLTLGAALDLNAGLGRPPAASSAGPLPALNTVPSLREGLDLQVPVRLPYADLSRAATQAAATRTLPLPVPTNPVLRVLGVTLSPAGPRLNAAVQVQVTGPLGLRVGATVDVQGTPALDPAGQTLTLKDVRVVTRREGVTGRVIGWLADARAQAYVQSAARFDLRPQLERARAQLQARLPLTPAPGLVLAGTVRTLSVAGVQVTPEALVVSGQATGDLRATVEMPR
ncbi:DUF4403 family protein [Deinococcus sp. HMF7604]|uniref:DUF4403 family protein n=1 Tax=Deinococcus betulae TaxID=2873312 RepID=UPI001CCFA439|nr:DUF4403 family protein [Deinococcus betulae]MBZ9749921.1 DUF4403 family protein [Deinococcus betulae]